MGGSRGEDEEDSCMKGLASRFPNVLQSLLSYSP